MVDFKYFLARRILLQVVVIFGVMTMTFFIYKAIPGNPIAVMLGDIAMRDPNLVRLVTEMWKLDQPPWVQFVWYMSNFLQGNFGISTWTRRPVLADLAQRFPATVELVVFGFLIAMAIGIPAGVISATRRGKLIDHFTRVFSIAGVCAPQFWWGVIFLLIFYLWLGFCGTGRLSHWFSAPPFVTGFYTIDSLLIGRFDMFLDALKHIVLPAFTIGITSCGLTMRLTRSSMLEVINSDYIRTARMKGLKERVVILRHALKNALIPPITYIGVLFGGMLGGSIMVETVFNWHGMGLYAVNVLFANDFPALMGVTFLMAIIYTTSNLIVDILYAFIDPRVRYG